MNIMRKLIGACVLKCLISLRVTRKTSNLLLLQGSGSRSLKNGRKKQVDLNPGQVALANKLKIPLEKYAAEVAKLEESERLMADRTPRETQTRQSQERKLGGQEQL